MRTVLIRPDYESTVVTPPLGLGYLSSFLKQNGTDVIIIDNLLYKYEMPVLIQKIKELKPDCIGIHCLSAFFEETKQLSLALKQYSEKVIIGGVHPTFLPYSTLKETNCDFVICGEGEKAFSELLSNNFNHKSVKGVYTIEDLTSDDNFETAEIIENLDDIPFPDWAQIKPKDYSLIPMGTVCEKTPVAPLMTTRGCDKTCKFCASPAFYKHKVRFRSPENVTEEMKLLLNEYGVREIQFIDDNPIVNPEYAKNLYALMRAKNINISWSCINGIRADSVTEETARLMKESGCCQVVIGVESADNEILRQIGKNETAEQIENAINILHDVGITTRGNFILGLPGETKQTLKKTIEFALKSKLDRAFFSVLDIIPGCALFKDKKYRSELSGALTSFIKPNWVPEGLTSQEIENALREAYIRFYSRPSKFFGIIKNMKISQYKHLVHRLSIFGIIKK